VTRRDRRALLIGGAVILGASLLLRGLPLLGAGWRENRERVEAQRMLLAETRRAIDALPRLEDSAHALARRVAGLAPRILSGSSGPVALSDLSGRMGTIVGLAHGRMLRFEALPDSAAAGQLRRVTAQIEIETDCRGIAEVLDYLDRGQLVAVTERLQITAIDPAALPSTPEQLNVVLRVSAWYLAREVAS
jgi:hypothetical protein